MAKRLALALAFALLMTTPANAMRFGFNDDFMDHPELAATAQQAHANVARVPLGWAWVQPTPAPVKWTYVDRIYNALIARGQRPIFVIYQAPRWSHPAHPATMATPRSSLYASFVAKVAARYPKAAAIELFNEPNQSPFYDQPNVKEYVTLVKAACAAIKKVAPTMSVIGGSPAPYTNKPADYGGIPIANASGIRAIDWVAFIKGIKRYGGTAALDGLSLHPYPGSTNVVSDFTRQLRTVQSITKLPIWITEIGISTCPGSIPAAAPDVQARQLVALYREAERFKVQSFIVHRLRDLKPDSGWESGSGLLNATGGLKPAFAALSALR